MAKTTYTLTIDSLDAEGRGVAQIPNEDGSPGKVVFVEGALPKEVVHCTSLKRKPRWEIAQTERIVKESSLRVKPKCPYFGKCGGCAMQHVDPFAQVAIKQRVLEDNLKHIGKVKPEQILPAIYGPFWGYRFRARLSVNYVPKKGGVLVGFREKQSRYVTDMTSCAVLPSFISDLLMPLRELIGGLSIYNQIPQIEVAVGLDGKELKVALLLRIMAPLTTDDEKKLNDFADKYRLQWWLQTKGPDTVVPFYPLDYQLQYQLPAFKVVMPFKPGDFTQVNHHINQVLVGRAIALLEIKNNERVADLFCGLGNFTVAMARLAKEVVGIEGSDILTKRAQEASQLNGVSNKTTFYTRNLFEITKEDWLALNTFDKILIDPPRDGAYTFCKMLATLENNKEYLPKRIVYVSCNPSTLARDLNVLVNEAGYTLNKAGIVNMFPHTAHVESMAVLSRN